MNPGKTQLSAIKAVLFVLCLLPAYGLWRGFELDTLGANPIEAITRGLGEWTLRFLLITLAVTPLRKYTGWHWIVRLRRMSQGLIDRLTSSYSKVMLTNSALLALGITGAITPQMSSLLHNGSTIAYSLSNAKAYLH